MENPMPENSSPKLPKIKAFKAIQKGFAMIGISPKLATQPYPCNGRLLFGILFFGSIIFMNVYVIDDAQTFFDYTQSIYVLSVEIVLTFSLILVILKVNEIFEFIDRCDGMLNMSLKYSATRSIYIEANQFEEKLSKILLFVMIQMTPLTLLVPWCMYIYFVYFTSDLGNAVFELPAPMWFPFDWQNPFGFLAAIAIQYVTVTYFFAIAAPALTLAIASYLYATAGSKIVKKSLFYINQSTQYEQNDQSILLNQIIEFLELHSCVEQLIISFSGVFQHLITTVFVWSLVTICGAMLMIQILLTQHGDSLAMFVMITIEAFYAFGILFMPCELGQRLNLAFAECSEMVDQFDWYSFPLEIQRMLPMILNFTQQPIDVMCFGSKASDRETFKSVLKTTYSYFTVLREFSD